jgi:hypothetical protein
VRLPVILWSPASPAARVWVWFGGKLSLDLSEHCLKDSFSARRWTPHHHSRNSSLTEKGKLKLLQKVQEVRNPSLEENSEFAGP